VRPAMTDARWVLGVDIGGTNLSVGLVPREGGPPAGRVVRPTDASRGGEAVTDTVIEMLRQVMAEVGVDPGRDVAGIGIGCPGPLDRATGLVLTTPNLGWKNFPVRDLIAGPLGLPAVLDNDANCATYGEWWMGAGRGVQTLVGLTVGTGVGGGIVLGGKVLHGASDAAGEIGHMTINYGGRRCKCGNYGCLEAYASGPNIAARAVEGIEAGEESSLPGLVDGDLDRITAETVFEAVLAGDAFASAVLLETARYLGVGLANLINLVNPDVVVIAGGVTRAGDALLDPLRAEVRRRAFLPAVSACRIVAAQLGADAGVIGAAGIFVDHLDAPVEGSDPVAGP
jgi:glucokinase